MEISLAVRLINQYKECPECGNKYIGNGKGGIYIDDDYFERSCECGWKVSHGSKRESYEV